MKSVLFVTIGKKPEDRTLWSGTPFSIFRELKKHYNLISLCLDCKCPIGARLRAKTYKLLGKYSDVFFDISYAKRLSFTLNQEICSNNYDAILVIGSSPLIEVKTSTPIIYFSDAVFSSMVDYYWYHVTSYYLKSGNYIQKKALVNSSHIVVTSNWAKRAAIQDYGINENKIDIVHFGPNIEINEFSHKEHRDINLLFIGVDWKRKGADYAVDCVKELNKMDKNFRYHLNLVGCNAPEKIEDENITIHGFLNKNINKQREKLDYLREISDIFILPTKAECSAVVFSEAAAFSLPTITFDTGGYRTMSIMVRMVIA